MSKKKIGHPDPPTNIVDVAGAAKRLTDRLLAAEQYIAALPWKVEAEVMQADVSLRFERRDRGWVLVCRESRMARSRARLPGESAHVYESMIPTERRWVECLLKDASVRSKAIAAELLPELIRTMRVEYDTRIANLAAGNAAMDLFEDSLPQGQLLAATMVAQINAIPFGKAESQERDERAGHYREAKIDKGGQ